MNPYEIEGKNKFLEAVDSITSHEIKPKSKVTFLSQVDLTEIEAIRADAAERGVAKPSYTAFIIKALALALRDHPYANRRVARGLWPLMLRPRLQKFNNIDVTVAIERQIEGAEMAAFVDIVRDADQLSIPVIQERLRELAESTLETNKQWREYSTLVNRFPTWFGGFLLRLPLYFPSFWVKYRGGAAMVSSPGKYGVDVIFANWWAPIAVSFGVVKKRPMVLDDKVVARQSFILTVNFDVRVMAGAQAAMFGRRFIDLLESAETELKPYLDLES
jgi:pyruvate/2-oxoglutarate dehydrogenase complex dihydrolipoamide acyltransferase (E2) component